MLYVIGLYRIPPRGGPDAEFGQFRWFLLAGPLRTAASAQGQLCIWRDRPTVLVDGKLWYAVYRMIVGSARLAWYGLTPTENVPTASPQDVEEER